MEQEEIERFVMDSLRAQPSVLSVTGIEDGGRTIAVETELGEYFVTIVPA